MYMLKKIPILCCLVFYLIGAQSIRAEPLITLNQDNFQEVLQYLINVYGDQIDIPQSDLQSYLSQWVNNFAVCGIPDVLSSDETPTTLSFSWPEVDGASSYTSGYLGLESGNSYQTQTSFSGLFVNGLQPELYLFTFYTHCGLGRSETHIIIVEKDLVIMPTPPEGSTCECIGEMENIDFDNSEMPVVPLYWSQPCTGFAQYRLDFTGWQTPDDGIIPDLESFSLYTLHSASESAIALYTCDGETPISLVGDSEADIIRPDPNGNYEVTATDESIIVHFNNPEFNLNTAQVSLCGCSESRRRNGPHNQEGITNQKAVKKENHFQVVPNPFQHRFTVYNSNLDEAIRAIELFDINGRVIERFFNNADSGIGLRERPIDLSRHAAGIYYCRIQSESAVQVLSLVKSN